MIVISMLPQTTRIWNAWPQNQSPPVSVNVYGAPACEYSLLCIYLNGMDTDVGHQQLHRGRSPVVETVHLATTTYTRRRLPMSKNHHHGQIDFEPVPEGWRHQAPLAHLLILTDSFNPDALCAQSQCR